MKAYQNNSKKPHVRILDNFIFTIILDIKYENARTLHTDGVYLFLGKQWLLTIHPRSVDLLNTVEQLLEVRNTTLTKSEIDSLYYNILSSLVNSYEQLLIAIEITTTDFEQNSLYKPSKKLLVHLDVLSR